jgi:hypothetical protein
MVVQLMKKVKIMSLIKKPDVPSDINFRNMIMWYFVACAKYAKGWDRKKLLSVASEISLIAQLVPLQEPTNSFKKGLMQEVVKDSKVKLISADENNIFMIKGVDSNTFTNGKLLAMFYYCVDELSGRQLSKNKNDFPHLFHARQLLMTDKHRVQEQVDVHHRVMK